MNKVMTEIFSGLDLLASTMGVGIRLHMDDKEALVNGSNAQLIRAIHNIVSNAIQATEPGKGIVHVFCEATEADVRIRIEDNGCGMSEEVKSRIFEPYFTTKAASSGTGLGMGIARTIIQEHNGSLAVESDEGEGTVMTIGLPRMREMAQAVA